MRQIANNDFQDKINLHRMRKRDSEQVLAAVDVANEINLLLLFSQTHAHSRLLSKLLHSDRLIPILNLAKPFAHPEGGEDVCQLQQPDASQPEEPKQAPSHRRTNCNTVTCSVALRMRICSGQHPSPTRIDKHCFGCRPSDQQHDT